MSDISRILSAASAGDPRAAEELLPLVYDELRKLAAARLAEEKPGQTLQATALVHEAYLRLVGDEASPGTAAAISSPLPRRRCGESSLSRPAASSGPKHGGGWRRIDLDEAARRHGRVRRSAAGPGPGADPTRASRPAAARVVELRYFAGLTMEQAAEVLGSTLRTAERNWTFARTWLHRESGSTPSTRGMSPHSPSKAIFLADSLLFLSH